MSVHSIWWLSSGPISANSVDVHKPLLLKSAIVGGEETKDDIVQMHNRIMEVIAKVDIS